MLPYADLSDTRCYYELAGNGEPLLLVPGLGRDGHTWDPVAEALARHFCVIRPDNRGIGRSTARRKPRRVRDYSADLAELLDHLMVERAHVMGLSLGGVIAQRFAVDHPSRIHRLILISSAQGFGPYLREVAQLIGKSLRWPPRPGLWRMMELLSAGPGYIDQNPIRLSERLKQLRQSQISSRAVMLQLRALRSSRFDEDEYQIASPTLVVAGEFDALIPHCYARQMAERIDNSQFILMPNVGHNPVVEAPERLAPLVVEFLSRGSVLTWTSREIPGSERLVA